MAPTVWPDLHTDYGLFERLEMTRSGYITIIRRHFMVLVSIHRID